MRTTVPRTRIGVLPVVTHIVRTSYRLGCSAVNHHLARNQRSSSLQAGNSSSLAIGTYELRAPRKSEFSPYSPGVAFGEITLDKVAGCESSAVKDANGVSWELEFSILFPKYAHSPMSKFELVTRH
jgi:hypothetical protein